MGFSSGVDAVRSRGDSMIRLLNHSNLEGGKTRGRLKQQLSHQPESQVLAIRRGWGCALPVFTHAGRAVVVLCGCLMVRVAWTHLDVLCAC